MFLRSTAGDVMPILDLIAAICFVTAVFDMMGNGVRYAQWAPWGVCIAAVVVLMHGVF